MPENPYKRPYLDSGVFIGWIKGETIKGIPRAAIGQQILEMAERGAYPIIISALTIAEVHKKRGKERLDDDANQNVLDYFEHDFVVPIVVDRTIGEEANKLCRQYEALKLSPNDAIHLACAKKAGCDVLLSWDDVLNQIQDPEIRTEEPSFYTPATPPPTLVDPQLKMFPLGDDNEKQQAAKSEIEPLPALVQRGNIGSTEDQTGTEVSNTEGDLEGKIDGKDEQAKEPTLVTVPLETEEDATPALTLAAMAEIEPLPVVLTERAKRRTPSPPDVAPPSEQS